MYSFRFNIVENVTKVANGIGRSFTAAGRSALGFARDVNTAGSATDRLGDEVAQFEQRRRSAFTGVSAFNSQLEGTLGIFRRLVGIAALVGVGTLAKEAASYSDKLYTSHSVIKAITRSQQGLNAAQNMANSYANKYGMSVGQATQGIAKMLNLTKGNVKEAGELTKLAKALEAIDPAQGFEGALFALKEIESGDTMSLRERFGIRVPTQEEAKKIAKRDGRTIQQVMMDSLREHLDNSVGGGEKGMGVEFYLNMQSNTLTGQIQRISNTFISMFTPALQSASERFIGILRTTNKWISENKDSIWAWVTVLGQVAVRAATLYGIFIGYQGIIGIWSALKIGVMLLNGQLYRSMFLAAWGVGQFRALAISASTWAYNTIMGTGAAIRSMGLYLANLWTANALYYRMAATMIWSKVVSGQLWASMVAGVSRWIALMSVSNAKLVAHRVLFYAAWGVGYIRSAVVALASYVTTLNFATIGQTILNTVMLMNPVGLFIAGVLALSAAFYGLYKLTEWLFPGIFSGITEWFGKAWDYIYKEFITPLMGFFKWLGDITGISAAFSTTTETDARSIYEEERDDRQGEGYGLAGGTKPGGLGISKAIENNVQGDRTTKNISINIGKQVENLVFHTVKDLSNISDEVRRVVERTLLDAVNEANYAM